MGTPDDEDLSAVVSVRCTAAERDRIATEAKNGPAGSNSALVRYYAIRSLDGWLLPDDERLAEAVAWASKVTGETEPGAAAREVLVRLHEAATRGGVKLGEMLAPVRPGPTKRVRRRP